MLGDILACPLLDLNHSGSDRCSENSPKVQSSLSRQRKVPKGPDYKTQAATQSAEAKLVREKSIKSQRITKVFIIAPCYLGIRTSYNQTSKS